MYETYYKYVYVKFRWSCKCSGHLVTLDLIIFQPIATLAIHPIGVPFPVPPALQDRKDPQEWERLDLLGRPVQEEEQLDRPVNPDLMVSLDPPGEALPDQLARHLQ